MIYLYVIKSEANGNLYVGICKDIASRLKEHNGGKNRYTNGLRPWRIAYSEEFPDKEKYYKSGIGKEYLNRKLAP